MKYTHSMRDFVKEYATVREVCFLEGIRFNSYKRAKCPICHGRGETFTTKDSINNFKCWSCGEFGDGITLYSKIHGTDFKESVIALAERLNYKEDEKVVVKASQPAKKVEVNIEKKELTAEQVELYDTVYEVLADVCGITPADYVYINRRKVKSNKMKDFFSLRYVDDVKLGKLIQVCTNKYKLNLEDIAKVPGFYLENGKLQIKKLYGIALKARNAQGKVIYIRRF